MYVSVHVQPATFTTGIDNISWWSDFTGWSYCAGCKVFVACLKQSDLYL